MAFFDGVIGTQGVVTGNTTLTITTTLFPQKSNTPVWERGYFGYSVTRVGTQTFSIYVIRTHAGTQVPIAGLSGIGTTTSGVLPILNERSIGVAVGTTQNASIGIAIPQQIVFGNSGIVGQTYSAVVTATLYTPR